MIDKRTVKKDPQKYVGAFEELIAIFKFYKNIETDLLAQCSILGKCSKVTTAWNSTRRADYRFQEAIIDTIDEIYGEDSELIKRSLSKDLDETDKNHINAFLMDKYDFIVSDDDEDNVLPFC